MKPCRQLVAIPIFAFPARNLPFPAPAGQFHYEVKTVMKMQDVKEIAKKRGMKTASMKKADIIRAIQQDEGNSDCYNTGNAEHCGQAECLWKNDCI